ncbi:MAG: hypothetical protein AAGU19_17205 [Prolixibacteraceae bacterium]
MILKRSCIYAKDVARITGKSLRAAERLLKQIRAELGKKDGMYITVDELAAYTGLSPDLIRGYLD